jgi:GNAT superfamily N-acetyltransferase
MKINVGCNLRKFKEYYKTCGRGEMGETEETIIKENSSHCIVCIEDQEILGHIIWHECTTVDHRKGDPRDKADREVLESLFGKNKQLVELHEVWLKEEYRGKGIGWEIFEFIEEFLLKKGFQNIVYYADHPAALTICRRQGYKEAFYEEENWHVFGKSIAN